MEFRNNSGLFTTSATLFAKQIKLDRQKSRLPVYDGGLGENPLPVPKSLSDAVEKFSHLKEYTDVQGVPELKEAIRKLYFPKENSCDSLRLLVGNGLKPLLYLVQLAFTKLYSREAILANHRPLFSAVERDDFVIVHLLPAWTSYIEQIKIIQGFDLQEIPGFGNTENLLGNPNYLAVEPDYNSQETGSSNITWSKITASQFEKQLIYHLSGHNLEASKTRILVLLNSPNNPSGCVYNSKELKDFADVFRKYKIICFADDIYAGIVHEPFCKDPEVFGGSIAKYYPEGTIQGSSLSKNWGCGGYRLGWVIFPLSGPKSEKNDPTVEDTLNSIYKLSTSLASSLYSCPSVMLQYVAAEALELSGSHLVPSPDCNDHVADDIINSNDVIQQIKFQREMFANVAALCKEKFNQFGILSSDAKGGWYLLLDFELNYGPKFLAKGILTSKELGETLIREIGFITVSCESFGIMPTRKNFLLRYSYIDIKNVNIWAKQNEKGYDTSQILAGLNALGQWLSRL